MKKKKRIKESFDYWKCQHCVLKPTWEPQRHDESSWNHRRLRSIRRVDSPLNGISDFLSCDTNAAIFNGWDSEKRTFRLKRKVVPNPELSIWCFVDIRHYFHDIVSEKFNRIRSFEFLNKLRNSRTNRQALRKMIKLLTTQ